MFEYVRDAGLRFEGARTKRKKTVGIVLHHLAGEGSVEDEHRYSISQGWLGIGYNFYVRLDGTVWAGRGLEYVGAHAGRKVKRSTSEWNKGANNNSQTVGIGLEGYYHPGSGLTRKDMPKAQYDACVRLMRDLRIKYPGIKWIKGHKEMPATATACPGDYFPLKELVQDGMAKASGSASGTNKAPAYTRMLKLATPNMQGDDVEAVQRALIATGADIAADGIFGPATERAVKRYQNAKGGLAVDGQVGPQTWAALMGGKTPTPAKVTITRLLKLTHPNMRGSDVRGVQELLRATGAKIEVDGIFGPNTERAVRRYQNAKGGLAVDGIVGRDTITALGGVWKG